MLALSIGFAQNHKMQLHWYSSVGSAGEEVSLRQPLMESPRGQQDEGEDRGRVSRAALRGLAAGGVHVDAAEPSRPPTPQSEPSSAVRALSENVQVHMCTVQYSVYTLQVYTNKADQQFGESLFTKE